MSAPENPPAFPTLGNIAHNSDWLTERGMTLRDYFAAKALPSTIGMVVGIAPPDQEHMVAEVVARLSYQMADAMLAESAK
jgi:hypothetical protein